MHQNFEGNRNRKYQAVKPSYKELVHRAIQNVVPHPEECGHPRWACVKDLFGIGSTTATVLCKEFGEDPNAIVESPPCSDCPNEDEVWT